MASRIASETSWMKLWDIALDYGPRGSSSLQALYRQLTRPQLQPGVCHLCGTTLDTPFFHHYTLYHTPLSDPERIINSLLFASSDIFVYANCPYFQCHAIVWLAVHKTLNFELCTYLLCVSVCLSVTALAAAAFVSACNQRHLRNLLLDFNSWIFEKAFRSKVMA